MISATIAANSDGGITYWTAGTIDREILAQRWPASLAGLLPSLRTPGAALKAALSAACDADLIRGHREEGRFSVVDEREIGGVLTYSVRFTVEATHSGLTWIVPPSYEEQGAIETAYQRAKIECSPQAVTAALVKMIDHLGGVSLRETGGIYWLGAQPKAWEAWQVIAEAIGLAKVAGKESVTVYRLQTRADPQTATAVIDGLRREITAECAAIVAVIHAGEVGPRGLRSKAAAADALVAKVESYERALGQSLADLRTALADTSAAATAASCAAMVEVAI